MRVLPRSRSRRVALAVVVVAVVASSPLWWSKAVFLVKLVFPGPAYDAAADRDSDAAPVDDVAALVGARPGPAAAPGPPVIGLGDLLPLDQPSAVADPPGPGHVLVATLAGVVHAVDLDTGEDEVVLDLTDEITSGGERGLLGAAIDPDGERLYLDFTDDERGDTEVRSWRLEDGVPVGGPGDGVLHLEIGQPFENHNGGNLAFGPDGALWIGTGDGGGVGDRGNTAQDPDSLLGKMLRVVPDPDGGLVAPSSNPDWGGRPEVWAIGLRNPWRYSFDRATGRLWIADVGQNTVEEVSVIDPDAERPNFGWSILEGNNRYKGDAQSGFTAPVVTYTHDDGCSIAGGYVYRGAEVPSLEGWYLFADLCGGWIRAVPADDPEVEPVELLADVGTVLAFAELEDGELLVLETDGLRRILGS